MSITTLPAEPIGATPKLDYTFTNAAGALADPTTLTFSITTPDGSVTTTYTYGVDPALVRDSLGVYHVYVTLDQPLTWHGSWTPGGDGAKPTQFEIPVVDISLFSPNTSGADLPTTSLIATLQATDATTLTFSDIPPTFRSLRLVVEVAISASFHLRCWLNGDTVDANYATTGWQSYVGYGGAPGSGSTGAIATAIFDQGGGAADYYTCEILLPMASDPARAGTAIYDTTQHSGGVSPGIAQTAGGIVWLGAQAITQIQLALTGATLTGTASLYGMQ